MTLAEALPQGALIWGHDHWSRETEFAAQTVEGLDAVKRQVGMLTGNKKAKRQTPYRLTRPEALKPKSAKGRIKSVSQFGDFARGLGGEP